MFDLIVIGGGAAGFFAALAAKKVNPKAKVALLEKSAALLSKVRVSGGGRCNVTHACFDPILLTKHYPRGARELLGPFNRFGPKDTIEWFESRGVSLKSEVDGRMFPTTDSSETIIDCLLYEADTLGVEIFLKQKIETIKPGFILTTKDGTSFQTRKLILATGSSQDGQLWAEELGHTIQPGVPSLFTFNVPGSSVAELSGISFKEATVRIKGTTFTQTGPLLITHFGFSGPAILKLSAWAARELNEKGYNFEILIDWLPKLSLKESLEILRQLKEQSPQKTLLSENPFQLPKNFWKLFCPPKRLNDFSSKEFLELTEKLHSDLYQVSGKTTHKEEFVTCGGITLKEVNFKTMESKVCPGLFFSGEVLDIDGITGGFNFQNAWTTGFIAGTSCLNSPF